jgi:hypothetical protein
MQSFMHVLAKVIHDIAPGYGQHTDPTYFRSLKCFLIAQLDLQPKAWLKLDLKYLKAEWHTHISQTTQVAHYGHKNSGGLYALTTRMQWHIQSHHSVQK